MRGHAIFRIVDIASGRSSAKYVRRATTSMKINAKSILLIVMLISVLNVPVRVSVRDAWRDTSNTMENVYVKYKIV